MDHSPRKRSTSDAEEGDFTDHQNTASFQHIRRVQILKAAKNRRISMWKKRATVKMKAKEALLERDSYWKNNFRPD
jgi:hypothetical protein